MRAMLRFLLCGAVVFVGLLGGIQPAYADDQLEVGKYSGKIDISMYLHTRQHYSEGGQTYTGDVRIEWTGTGLIHLEVIDAQVGKVSLPYLPVRIYDFGYGAVTKPACNVSIGIEGYGKFSDTSPATFDLTKKTGESQLNAYILPNHEILYQGAGGFCRNTKVDMSTSQLKAIRETSKRIRRIGLTITDFDDEWIEGSCSLPGWEVVSMSIPLGSTTRKVESCYWRVSEEGAKEWEEK